MNRTTPDDADLDRILTEHLDAEVEDVTAGPALLDRIRAEAGTTAGARHRGRPSTRWLWPIAAAAAVVLAIVFITAGGEDDTDVATGENLDAPETQVVLSGEAGGEEWSVVEYVEDDPSIVDEPTTCLRFEPTIEDGPFFCGTEDDLVGAHGKLVWRRSDRSGEQIAFNDHAVFAGVFGSEVAEVTLRVDGQEIIIEPTPWPGRDLGIAVAMQRVPDDSEYDGVLRDADDQVLSIGSSSGQADPDAESSVVAEPASAAPGQTVELRFPTEMTRGVAWHMSRYDPATARWSEPVYLLLSDRSDGPAAPTWLPGDAEWTWDSTTVTGPGPDTIVIPDSADPAIYRMCPADDAESVNCAAVTVGPG